MRTGLFGGTFDPIHVGHLDVAEAARSALDLSLVEFVPARTPPHRAPPYASATHRVAMVALAIADRPALRLSDLDMDATGPSYTTETLDRLVARGRDLRQVFVITGADAFLDIAKWKNYPALLERCHFVVVSRPGTAAPALRKALPEVAPRMVDAGTPLPTRPSIVLVDAPTAPVSATDVRRAVADREGLAARVPVAVAAYIERQGLYAPRSTSDNQEGVA